VSTQVLRQGIGIVAAWHVLMVVIGDAFELLQGLGHAISLDLLLLLLLANWMTWNPVS